MSINDTKVSEELSVVIRDLEKIDQPSLAKVRQTDDAPVVVQRRPLSNISSNPSRIFLKALTSLSIRHSTETSVLVGESARIHFDELLKLPISDQQKKYFTNYFKMDLDDKIFSLDEFRRLFQIKELLCRRIVKVFHLEHSLESKTINGEDIIRIANTLWTSSMSIKALILFKLFDENDNDRISSDDIRNFYQFYLGEHNILKDEQRSKEIIEIFLQGLFGNNTLNSNDTLNYQEFYGILRRDPSLFHSLNLISIPDKNDDESCLWYQRLFAYAKNNRNKLCIIAIYLLVMILLMIYVIVYRMNTLQDHSVWRMIARITGMWLYFNYTLVICLMLKKTMSFIRHSRSFRSIIPVDDHIDAHRIIGTILILLGVVHTISYMIYFATLTDDSWLELMFTRTASLGWVDDSAPITGVLLVGLLIIMFTFSLQCLRERPGFHAVFRHTHLIIFWCVFILATIHAEHFWKWSIGPMVFYVCEKIYFLKRFIPQYGRTHLAAVRLEDENVVTMMIERPRHFHFHMGDYVNICLPSISFNEWHPFTICSSPERGDILRVSIFKKKNWTRKVYQYFQSLDTRGIENSDLTEVAIASKSSKSYPREINISQTDECGIICLEGPFRTSTSYIFDCEHVVLIGAGIGITPYISVLETIMYRLKAAQHCCKNCGTRNHHENMLNSQKLRKVDVIWVNRHMENIRWFYNLFNDLVRDHQEFVYTIDDKNCNRECDLQSKYIDIHLYCTSIRSNEQTMLENVPLELVTKMYNILRNEDMHTELPIPMQFGRPPWKILFSKFKANYKKSHIFFTGNYTMGKEIGKYCDQFEFRFQHEPFS